MVVINVHICESMYKLSRLEISDLGQEKGEQGIAGNIEGDPETHIGTPLVQETRQLVILNVELGKDVARGQRHLAQIGGIPGAHDVPATGGVGSERLDDLLQLVHSLAGIVCGCTLVGGSEVSPLEAVDRPQVSFGASLLADAVQVLATAVSVPNVHAFLAQLSGVRAPFEEPQ